MPPTAPSGIPCVSIVHARLFVDGKDHGPKVFLVKLHDGKKMNVGVISRLVEILSEVNISATIFTGSSLPVVELGQ